MVSVLIDKPWGNEKQKRVGAMGLRDRMDCCRHVLWVQYIPRNRKQKQKETFMNRST